MQRGNNFNVSLHIALFYFILNILLMFYKTLKCEELTFVSNTKYNILTHIYVLHVHKGHVLQKIRFNFFSIIKSNRYKNS